MDICTLGHGTDSSSGKSGGGGSRNGNEGFGSMGECDGGSGEVFSQNVRHPSSATGTSVYS